MAYQSNPLSSCANQTTFIRFALGLPRFSGHFDQPASVAVGLRESWRSYSTGLRYLRLEWRRLRS